MRIFSAITTLVLLSFVASAQQKDTITFVTGSTLITDDISFEDSVVVVREIKKNGKEKFEYFDHDYIYSITGAHDSLYYRQDSAKGFYYSVQDMQYFIWGAQDAMKSYRTRWVSTFGVLYGAAASYPIYESFYVFAVPFPYIAFGALSGVSLKEEYVTYPDIRNESAYMHGYQHAAKGRKVLASFFSSIAGTVVGISIGHLTHQ